MIHPDPVATVIPDEAKGEFRYPYNAPYSWKLIRVAHLKHGGRDVRIVSTWLTDKAHVPTVIEAIAASGSRFISMKRLSQSVTYDYYLAWAGSAFEATALLNGHLDPHAPVVRRYALPSRTAVA